MLLTWILRPLKEETLHIGLHLHLQQAGASIQVSHFKKVWDSYCDLWLKCKRVVVVIIVVVVVVVVV